MQKLAAFAPAAAVMEVFIAEHPGIADDCVAGGPRTVVCRLSFFFFFGRLIKFGLPRFVFYFVPNFSSQGFLGMFLDLCFSGSFLPGVFWVMLSSPS